MWAHGKVAVHGPGSGARGSSAASRQAEGGVAAKTHGVGRCCRRDRGGRRDRGDMRDRGSMRDRGGVRDRGSARASGIVWDRGDGGPPRWVVQDSGAT